MNSSDVLRLSYGVFKKRQLRSALTILGIMIGAAVVVGLVSATQGVSASIVGELGKLGADVLVVSPTSSSTRLTPVEERLITTQIPQAEVIAPIYGSKIRLQSGREVNEISLFGINQAQFPMIFKGFTVAQGEIVPPFDAGGIFLGAKVANPPGDNKPFARLNQAITVETVRNGIGGLESNTRSFVVRGIAAEYGPAMLIDLDNAAFITLDAARALFGQSSYSSLFVVARSPEYVDQIESSLKEMLGEDIEIRTTKRVLDIAQRITRILTLFLGGIAVISLVVAGIGIANIMFVAVMERTREIGVLKALGFKRRNILWIFLSEALLTGFIGGVLGVGLGILFGYGITNFIVRGFGNPEDLELGNALTEVAPIFTFDLLILALLFALLVAALAGFYPSWKASQMDPISALRSE